MTWTNPEQFNTETGEVLKLEKKIGVVGGEIVECWIVPGQSKQTNVMTPESEAEVASN